MLRFKQRGFKGLPNRRTTTHSNIILRNLNRQRSIASGNCWFCYDLLGMYVASLANKMHSFFYKKLRRKKVEKSVLP